MLKTVRFVSGISAIYLLTIGLVGYTLLPSDIFSTPVHAGTRVLTPIPHKPVNDRLVVVSGQPVRLVVPDYGIDLVIDEGHYDPTTETWSLSDTRAQFAMMSSQANNKAGNTFIYGHGTDAIFGKMGTKTPPFNTLALVYTDNGHVFSYRFQEATNLQPSDTTLLNDLESGPPTLTLQTCTGTFSEWRTMFRFAFERVEK